MYWYSINFVILAAGFVGIHIFPIKMSSIKTEKQSPVSYNTSLVLRKPVFGVFDQVRHKPGCTATEDGKRLEISDLGSRGIVLSV